MTQIRGRIKTIVDYNTLNVGLGVCCKADGTKHDELKSLNECNKLGGKWINSTNIDSVTCPQPGERGCCCSCSYTTKNTGTSEDWTHPSHYSIVPIGRLGSPNGLKNDISKCECEYLNGNWSSGSCPSGDSVESAIDRQARCATDGIQERNDVRWPFACCSCKEDSQGNLVRDCTSVCSSEECLELQNAYYPDNQNCAGEFDIFTICDYSTLQGREPKFCSQSGPILPDSIFDGVIVPEEPPAPPGPPPSPPGSPPPPPSPPPSPPPPPTTPFVPTDLGTDLVAWYRPEDITSSTTIWNNSSSRGGVVSLLSAGQGQRPEPLVGNNRIELGQNEYDLGYFCGALPEQLVAWPSSGVPINSFYYRGNVPAGDWAGDYDLNSYHKPLESSHFRIEKNKDYVVVAVHQSIFQSGIQPLNDTGPVGFYLGDYAEMADGSILSIGQQQFQANTDGSQFTSFRAQHAIADSLPFYSTATNGKARIGTGIYEPSGSFLQAETVIDPQVRFTIWHMRQSPDVRDITAEGNGTNLSTIPQHHISIKQLACNGNVISNIPADYRLTDGEGAKVAYENLHPTVRVGSEVVVPGAAENYSHINLIELFVIKKDTGIPVNDPTTGNYIGDIRVVSEQTIEDIILYLKTKYPMMNGSSAIAPGAARAGGEGVINLRKEGDAVTYGQILYDYPDSSSCCILNKETNEFECSNLARAQCEARNGFYNIPSDIDGPVLCSNTVCPDAPTVDDLGIVTPPSIKSSSLPEEGKLFAGGVYIGTFQSGISKALVNLETGASSYRKTVSVDGPGDKRKWALILCPSDLGNEFGVHNLVYQHTTTSEKIEQEKTSTFDGLYNTYGKNGDKVAPQTHLYRQIRNFNRFGFSDWYLPSIEELGFIAAQQLNIDFGVNILRYSQNQSKLGANEAYLSSSRKLRKNKNKRETTYPAANLVYASLIGDYLGPLNGFTVLTGLDNMFRVRLVRRIYVED